MYNNDEWEVAGIGIPIRFEFQKVELQKVDWEIRSLLLRDEKLFMTKTVFSISTVMFLFVCFVSNVRTASTLL